MGKPILPINKNKPTLAAAHGNPNSSAPKMMKKFAITIGSAPSGIANIDPTAYNAANNAIKLINEEDFYP